jgi:hypothetical protein
MMGRVCTSPAVMSAEHVLQLGGLLLGQLGVAELASTVGGDFTRTALVAAP